MEPPSYEEASLHPPALSTEGFSLPPPPSYDASFSSPSTPPPTYGEAVTFQPDPFPVLIPPSLPTAVISHPQNAGNIVHPHTHVCVNGRRAQPVVVTQPQPVPVSVACLRDVPTLVRCPHCHRVVTTKVTYLPGRASWCMCILLTMMGLVCGFCLIPFMVRGLQDAHHSCPLCKNHLYIYTR